MIFGLDYLAGARFGKLITQNHPRGWAAGFFLDVDGFGYALEEIEELAASGLCPIFRIHGIWKDRHDFSSIDSGAAISRAQPVQALAKKYPQIKFEYSPFCEHEISDVKTIDKILDDVQSVAPNCTLVNTVYGRGAFSKKYKNEVHGEKAPPTTGKFNFSFDGTSAVDSDVEYFKKRFGRSEVFYLWDPLFNLRAETTDTTPRKDRHLLPESKLIQSLVFLSTDRMDSFIKIDKRTLYKSHGEVHASKENPANADSRSNDPCIITPYDADHIEFRLASGEVVAKSGGPLPFRDGRNRFYINKWGYEIARDAIRKSGGPHVRMFAGKKDLGTINPGFRAGK